MLGPNWVPMWVITREVPWWDESWVDWMEELSDGRMGILWVGLLFGCRLGAVDGLTVGSIDG